MLCIHILLHYSFSIYTDYKPSGIILTFPFHPKPPHTLIHIIVLYHIIITYLNIIYVAEPCLIDMDAVVMASDDSLGRGAGA